MSGPGLPFQNSAHGLLSWFLDERSSTLDNEGAHRPAAVASHIAACFRELGKPGSPEGAPIVKMGRPYDPETYVAEDGEFRGLVADLMTFVCERIAPHASHYFLQGSLGTLDYSKGWSDVDSFLVIKDSTVCDGRRLLALRSLCLETWDLFLRICPLQHHGFIICTESELLRYPSHYMPPAVFDESLAILPEQGPIRFHSVAKEGGAARSLKERRDAARDAMKDGVFRHHPKHGVYLEAKYRNAHDAMGQLFALLGYVMTVPAFLLDAIGRPCYKRDSFAQARPLFTPRAWSIVEKSSCIRAEWGRRESNFYRGNAIPRWVREMLGQDYVEECCVFLDEAVALAEKGESIPTDRT